MIMNFITTNHRGGLGNVMFKLAASISLSIDNGVEYIFSNEFLRPIDGITTKGLPDYRRFYDNVLRNVKFIDKLPDNYLVHTEKQFNYEEIPYTKGTNLLLDGYFQSEKYFENNKQFIIDLFGPNEEIKNRVLINLPDVSSYTSIHIRRGDYLQFPNHHPQQSVEYYKKATEIIGLDKTYLIFSDDLEGVKNMFDFLPNKIFYTSNEDWLDMYTMSLCKNNIICNSTFSWWAAYLNPHNDKKIITTNNWFGPAYGNWDISTLFPKNWIRL
jgi:hypothetical protein